MDRLRRFVSSVRLERWLDRGIHLVVLGVVLPTVLGVLTFLLFLVFPLVPFLGLALLPMLGAGAAKAAVPQSSAVVARSPSDDNTGYLPHGLTSKRA